MRVETPGAEWLPVFLSLQRRSVFVGGGAALETSNNGGGAVEERDDVGIVPYIFFGIWQKEKPGVVDQTTPGSS